MKTLRYLALSLLLLTPAAFGQNVVVTNPAVAPSANKIGAVNVILRDTTGAYVAAGGAGGAVSGNKSNNNAAPGATNIGALGYIANAAAPSYTEGNLVLGSLDLSGNQRVSAPALNVAQGATLGTNTGPMVQGSVATAAPTYTTGQISPLSLTTAGSVRSDTNSIAGVTITTGPGNATTGTARVILSNDSPGASTLAAAVPTKGMYVSGIATTANPANATAGNSVGLMMDKAGRTVVVPSQVRELVASQQTNIAASSETTIVTAGGAGVFNDITDIIITTAGAAAQTITIKDATAGTTRFVLNYPNAAIAPGAPLVLHFSPPLSQAAAAANWTATQSTTTASNYTVVYVQNK